MLADSPCPRCGITPGDVAPAADELRRRCGCDRSHEAEAPSPPAVPSAVHVEAEPSDDPAAGVLPTCISGVGQPSRNPPPGAGTPGPSPGSSLGRFHLLEALGTGGMGVVWKAWDPNLRRLVALKLIRPEFAGDAEVGVRFLREARIAARLRHPGIAAIYEVGTADDAPYLCMEFIEGRTLAEEFARSVATKSKGAEAAMVAWKRETALLAAAAEAVAYAHELGVVHRDLKPGNILVKADDTVAVVDFGLAKEVRHATALGGPATVSGQALGTPEYMSPEQVEGQLARIGPRSDVWALGCSLYEILTGRRPFDRGSPWQTLYAVIEEEPSAPRERVRSAPVALESICLKALEKDPERRYGNAGAFAVDLRRWLAGQPVSARPRARLGRLWRWTRRHRRRSAVVVLAFLVALAGLFANAWRGSGQDARAQAVVRQTLAGIGAAVLRFQDEVERTELSPQACTLLAEQPLRLLDDLIAHHPDYGPAYAWRGRVRSLLGRESAAEEDFARACACSPRSALVWYLRGQQAIDRYAASRGVPTPGLATAESTTLDLSPLAPESAAELRWRDQGLEYLRRMATAEEDLEDVDPAQAALGGAMLAVYSGELDRLDPALRRLDGVPGPAAAELRGHALLLRGRLESAVQELSQATSAWPRRISALWLLGAAAHALGLQQAAAGADPIPEYQRALDAYRRVARVISTNPWLASVQISAVHVTWAEADEAAGRSPTEEFQRAIDALGAAIGGEGGQFILRKDRGFLWLRLARAQLRAGLPAQAAFRSAGADYDAVCGRFPSYVDAHVGAATAAAGLAADARYQGQDAEPFLREAAARFEIADQRFPANPLVCVNLGTFLEERAVWEAQHGRDPRPALRQALDCHERVTPRAPVLSAWAIDARVPLSQWLAAATLARGEPAAADFARARRAVEDAEAGHRAGARAGAVRLLLGLGAIDELAARLEVWSHEEAAASLSPWPTRSELLAHPPLAGEAALEWAEFLLSRTDEEPARVLFEQGVRALEAAWAQLPESERSVRSAGPLGIRRRNAHYNLACLIARAADGWVGRLERRSPKTGSERDAGREQAFRHLQESSRLGFADREHAAADPDLASLHDDPRWQAWLETLPAQAPDPDK